PDRHGQRLSLEPEGQEPRWRGQPLPLLVVALDADTGKYKWHYQTVPGETWDYNSSMDIVLADLKVHGKTVKALMHAPKNGFFYVIDRSNGKLVSVGKIAKTTWATDIDRKTGRPIEVKGSRYENGDAILR